MKPIQEPISTFTSLAFLGVCVFVALFEGASDSLLVASLGALAVGSFMFHLSGSERNTPAHRMDEGAIYAVLAALLYHAWGESAWVLLFASLAASVTMLYLARLNLVVIAPLVGLIGLAGIGITEGARDVLIVLAALIPALIARLLSEDFLKDVLHGLWHLLIALAAALAWWVTR